MTESQTSNETHLNLLKEVERLALEGRNQKQIAEGSGDPLKWPSSTLSDRLKCEIYFPSPLSFHHKFQNAKGNYATKHRNY